MGLRSWWDGLFGQPPKRDVVHDFTFNFNGHQVHQVKVLVDGRVFLVGVTLNEMATGDRIRARLAPKQPIVTCKIESISFRNDVWRAYARVEQLSAREVRKNHGTVTEKGARGHASLR